MIIALLVALPLLVTQPYAQYVLIQLFLFITLAQSWNLISGYTGQPCFGQETFFALGAYTTAFVWLGLGSPIMAVPLSAAIATIAAFGIGYPSFRTRGAYFAIVTLSFNEALRIIFTNTDLVGGAYGISLPVTPISYTKVPFYYLSLGLALFSVFLAHRIRNSKLGLGLISIREDEDAAQASGLNTLKYKLIVFAISAVLASLAGVFFVCYNLYVDPATAFSVELMFEMIIMVTIGGAGTIIGPVIGAVIMIVITQGISLSFSAYHLLISGALLIVTILFLPRGFISLIEKFGLKLP